ncbi:hypothetical protein B5M09_013280 [Aphanomyces astaci]|uniref:Uncharacterized protein n=1 Tax=Aphanomyces astaci TaxID=112090 RepID=A0A3R7WRG8_APHAT|nr:hypothetical protein B5M09_013280 [Aphanomyces astaci]
MSRTVSSPAPPPSGKLADAAILDLALLHTESASLTTSQIHPPTESTASLPFQSSYSADRMLAASEVIHHE